MANLCKIRISTEYFRFLVKRNVRFMVLSTIAMFVLYPLLAFTEYIISGSYGSFVFTMGQIFLTILLVLSIFIVPFLLYSYMNSKRNLDVYHALPIKRKDLFVTTLLSGFVLVFIPFTLTFAAGGIYQLLVIQGIDWVLMLKQYFYSVALILPIMGPILFAMMNTGTGVDGLIYGIIIHLIPGILYGAYLVYGNTMLLGFAVNDPSLFLLYASPIWSLFELVFNTTREYPNPMLIAIYWIVIGIAISYLNLYFYQIRKSERAENPFTNIWFFPIIVTVFTLIVQIFFYSTFASMNQNYDGMLRIDYRMLIFPVFFTFVMYLILDVIAHRGFKNLIKAMGVFALITAVSLGGFTISASSNGLGYVTSIPTSSNVKEVELSMYDQYGLIFASDYRYSYPSSQSNKLIFKDDTSIEAIIKTHQTILDGYKEFNYRKVWSSQNPIESKYPFTLSDEYFNTSITIKYTMNNGSSMIRSYSIPYAWTYDLLPLVASEEVFNQKYPQFGRLDMWSRYRTFEITNTLFSTFTDSNTVSNDSEVLKEVAKRYKEDYLALNYEEIIFSKEPILGFFLVEPCTTTTNCHPNIMPITAKFTRTLAYLDSINVSIPEVTLPTGPTTIVLPNSNSDRSPFFMIQNLSGIYDVYYRMEKDYVSSQFDVIDVDPEDLMPLLPYMMNGSIMSSAMGTVRIRPGNFIMERNSTYLFFTLTEGAADLLEQYKSIYPIRRVSLDSILWND